MRLVLRADAGPGIGVGHLARCAAVAEEAVARGWTTTLVGTATNADWLLARFAELDVEVRPDWTRADTVHIDHYGEITPPDALIVSMEDGPFGRRRADIAVDANLTAATFTAADLAVGATHAAAADRDTARGAAARPDDGTPRYLRGPAYAPLRAAVRSARSQVESLNNPTKERLRVVVAMGGGDAGAHVDAAVVALAETGLDLDVLAVAPVRPSEIVGRASVTYTGPRADLPALFASADLVVSAAGVTLLELCCIGVPTALVVIADNQRQGYAAALDLGVAVDLADAPDLLTDPAARARVAATAKRTVDGHGARRLLNAAAGIALRPATPHDADRLLDWRNDAGTRRWSVSSDPVAPDQHRRWLAGALTASTVLIAEERGVPVGVVRFDHRAAGEAEVSITIAPGARGRGLARPVLEAAHDEVPGVRVLARVHRDNATSRRLFAAAGYRPADVPPDGPFDWFAL